MDFHVKALRYWKKENGCLDKCEDALAYDESAALFAVADGVGTLSESGLWADILVRQSIDEPLADNDGFEVEYWVRKAQGHFYEHSEVTDDSIMFRSDARNEGSAATFLAAQFIPAPSVEPNPNDEKLATGTCSLIAIGDSCAFHYREGRLLEAFPISSSAEFRSRLPVCFPTQGYKSEWWRNVLKHDFSVQAGDVVVLATDAVSEWLLGDSMDLPSDRFQLLIHTDQNTWCGFVDLLRHARVMDDDDSTALIIEIGDITGHQPQADKLRDQCKCLRHAGFEHAWRNEDLVNIALEYGVGDFFDEAMAKYQGRKLPLDQHSRLLHAREVTEGLRTLRGAIERFFDANRNDRPRHLNILETLWGRFRSVLCDEELGEGIRDALRQIGVQLDPGQLRSNEELLEVENDIVTTPSDASPPKCHFHDKQESTLVAMPDNCLSAQQSPDSAEPEDTRSSSTVDGPRGSDPPAIEQGDDSTDNIEKTIAHDIGPEIDEPM